MKAFVTFGLIVLSVSVFSLMEVISYKQRRIEQLRSDNQTLQALADKSQHAAQTYINMHGREVSRNKVLSLSLESARAMRETPQLSFVKEFAEVKKNLSNLQAVMTAQVQVEQSLKLKARDTVITTRSHGVPGDTVVARAFSYEDEYNSIKGFLKEDTTYLYQVHLEVPLQGVIYRGRRTKKFLFFRYGPRESISEITSPNPWVHIKDQQLIKIEKR